MTKEKFEKMVSERNKIYVYSFLKRVKKFNKADFGAFQINNSSYFVVKVS
ncbi:MAG: hypothetical protein LBR69_03065 [Endomicrobium sp.]|jgi:hypothetical protein|nr:hypothetical protein [Endomicrobium sp.]